MDKFIGFAIGWAIVDTIFAIIVFFWNLFLSTMAILWLGFSRICKSLYSSYKNRKSKTNSKE